MVLYSPDYRLRYTEKLYSTENSSSVLWTGLSMLRTFSVCYPQDPLPNTVLKKHFIPSTGSHTVHAASEACILELKVIATFLSHPSWCQLLYTLDIKMNSKAIHSLWAQHAEYKLQVSIIPNQELNSWFCVIWQFLKTLVFMGLYRRLTITGL